MDNRQQDEITKKMGKSRLVLELSFLLSFSIAIFILAAHYDFLEQIVEFSKRHEHWELDEFITVSIFLTGALAIISVNKWRELLLIRSVLTIRNQELQKALLEIKQLEGIIPICAKCKKIRDDTGYWNQIEAYIENHSEAMFSHSICPECAEELYGEQEWYKKVKQKK